MASELIGTQLDHYFLLSRIGAGGSAAIYRAHDAREDRYVALKVLPHHFAENDELYQRFAREALMAARLTHPHILPVYDYGEAEGIPYIAMRLVDGGTLDDFVREGPLPLPFITRVLGDIASALDYAHARG
ncbi:MAG: serine/threonine-protein kinase, partial [Chloroflexota bacterium]